jgi:hypothetical protein
MKEIKDISIADSSKRNVSGVQTTALLAEPMARDKLDHPPPIDEAQAPYSQRRSFLTQSRYNRQRNTVS